jgi:hypothetical protein
MKKILLLLPRNIFPALDGYANYRKELIEILHEQSELSIVVISSKKISNEEKSFYENHSFLYKYIRVSLIKHFIGAFLALCSGEPLQSGFYYFKHIQKAVDSMIQENDIIIGALIRVMKYFEKYIGKKYIIYDAADSIGLHYQMAIKKTHSAIWKILYEIEARRLLDYEGYWIEKADVTVLFNKNEVKYWNNTGNVVLMPYAVKTKLLEYNQCDEKYSGYVAFIGRMNTQPNIEAVEWYIKNVHSLIGDEIPFIILGAKPTKKLCQIAKTCRNITVTGYMQDPYIILNSAMAVVSPIQIGAGIQTKILEAMALGKINIISSLAA